MDVNSGKPWSEMDIVRTATRPSTTGTRSCKSVSFLCRDEDEVRQKARQLGLVEHPGRRLKVVR